MEKLIFDMGRRGRQFIIEGIHAGDNGIRSFEFIFSHFGKTFTLPKNCTATLFAALPDGTLIYDTCFVKESSVTYCLKGGTEEGAGITSVAGTVECEIRIISNAGEILTSPAFAIRVDSVLQNDSAIEASESFSALNEAIIRVTELEEVLPRSFTFIYDMDGDGEHDENNKSLFTSLLKKLADGYSVSVQLRAYNDTIPSSFIEAGNGLYRIAALDHNYNEMLTIEFKTSDNSVTYSKSIIEVAQGPAGNDGKIGLSAYEIALEGGFVGSEAQWLESLKGENGKDGADGKDGVNGTNGADGKDGLDGKDGQDGADGLSAYQIALNFGFEGTEEEWLASLKGEKGDKGEDGKDGADGSGSGSGSGGSGDCNLPEVAPVSRVDLLAETDLGTFAYLSDFGAFGVVSQLTALNLSLGDKIKVVWDKTDTFDCTVQNADSIISGSLAFGNLAGFDLEGNGEPFIVGFNDQMTIILSTEDTSGKQHYIEIYRLAPSPDEEKFLRVINGIPTWVTIELAEDGGF